MIDAGNPHQLKEKNGKLSISISANIEIAK
jgi:hypothetical protein